MFPNTPRPRTNPAVTASVLWLFAQMLLPVESSAQAPDAPGESVNPTLQGIPPQDLILERPAAILPSDQAEAAAATASARTAPRAAQAESGSALSLVASIAGGLLMIVLVIAGIALTVTALRTDRLQRRRRYRRRTRRDSSAPSPVKQPGTP